MLSTVSGDCQTNPWTSNRYAYAGGNPTTLIEIDGHKFCETMYCDGNASNDGYVDMTGESHDPTPRCYGIDCIAEQEKQQPEPTWQNGDCTRMSMLQDGCPITTGSDGIHITLDSGVIGYCAGYTAQFGYGESGTDCLVTDFDTAGITATHAKFGGPSESISINRGWMWSSAHTVEDLEGSSLYATISAGEIGGRRLSFAFSGSDNGIFGLPFNVKVSLTKGPAANHTLPVYPFSVGLGTADTTVLD